VIDRVHKARPDGEWHDTIRYDGGILDGRTKGVEIASAKSGVDLVTPFRVGEP
jgi:hypothetical protein